MKILFFIGIALVSLPGCSSDSDPPEDNGEYLMFEDDGGFALTPAVLPPSRARRLEEAPTQVITLTSENASSWEVLRCDIGQYNSSVLVAVFNGECMKDTADGIFTVACPEGCGLGAAQGACKCSSLADGFMVITTPDQNMAFADRDGNAKNDSYIVFGTPGTPATKGPKNKATKVKPVKGKGPKTDKPDGAPQTIPVQINFLNSGEYLMTQDIKGDGDDGELYTLLTGARNKATKWRMHPCSSGKAVVISADKKKQCMVRRDEFSGAMTETCPVACLPSRKTACDCSKPDLANFLIVVNNQTMAFADSDGMAKTSGYFQEANDSKRVDLVEAANAGQIMIMYGR